MIISGDDLLILLAGGLLYDRDMTLYGKPIIYPKPQKIREIEISREALENFAENLQFHLRLSYSNVCQAYNKLEVSLPSENDRVYWERFFEYQGGTYITFPSAKLEASYRGLLMMKATTSSDIRRAANAKNVKVKVLYVK